MKKVMRNMSLVLSLACMLLFGQTALAADGTLQFSDPTVKAGEEVSVTVKIEAGGAAIGDGSATVVYDTSKLEFVRGTNAEMTTPGTLELFAAGTGTETELNYELVFKALSEGTTTLEATGVTAYLYSDETLNLEQGSSTVTIEAGDATAAEGTETSGAVTPSGDGTVEMDGTTYTIYEDFTDALIPEGFSRTSIQYNGGTHNAVQQDVSGKTMVFLRTGENDPVMALYEEDSFCAAQEVSLNENSSIFLLAKGDGSSLPSQYQETTLEMNGTILPTWQNMDNKEFYLVYALGTNGEEGFYQYDTVENSFQRYNESSQTADAPEEGTSEGDTLIDKIQSVVDQAFPVFLAAAVVILVIFIIVIIVQTVKLSRRNTELDELYDEMEAKGKSVPTSGEDRKRFIKKEDQYDDDDYMEEDMESEDILDDNTDYLTVDDDDDNSDEYIDDADDDEDYDIDFIDL
jgi:hypothetical protein